MRYLTTAAAAAALASAASAGPIGWTYTTTAGGNNGSVYFADGTGGRPDATSPDGFQHYTGYATFAADPSAAPLSGSAQVNLAHVDFTDFYWDARTPTGGGAPGTIDPGYTVSLTIRDAASGRSGTVSVSGTALSEDPYLGLTPDLFLPPSSELNTGGSPVQTLVLGGNRYNVQFVEVKANVQQGWGEPTWDRLTVVADVQVAAVQQTPEPATLALAGIGLAAGLCRLVARRR